MSDSATLSPHVQNNVVQHDATQNKEASVEIALKRMLWRCRRGMLELDIVLQRFVHQYFATLTEEEQAGLQALLDLPDQQFWACIQNVPSAAEQTMPELSVEQYALLAKMRTSAQP